MLHILGTVSSCLNLPFLLRRPSLLASRRSFFATLPLCTFLLHLLPKALLGTFFISERLHQTFDIPSKSFHVLFKWSWVRSLSYLDLLFDMVDCISGV